MRNGDEEDGSEGGESGTHSSRSMPKPKIGAAQAAAVTNVVAGRVGNLLGKGIGGLSSKLGSGGWFWILWIYSSIYIFSRPASDGSFVALLRAKSTVALFNLFCLTSENNGFDKYKSIP